MRRPGLADEVQRMYRVGIAGPATLSALLKRAGLQWTTVNLPWPETRRCGINISSHVSKLERLEIFGKRLMVIYGLASSQEEM